MIPRKISLINSRFIYRFCYNSPVYSVQHANTYTGILLRVTAEKNDVTIKGSYSFRNDFV